MKTRPVFILMILLVSGMAGAFSLLPPRADATLPSKASVQIRAITNYGHWYPSETPGQVKDIVSQIHNDTGKAITVFSFIDAPVKPSDSISGWVGTADTYLSAVKTKAGGDIIPRLGLDFYMSGSPWLSKPYCDPHNATDCGPHFFYKMSAELLQFTAISSGSKTVELDAWDTMSRYESPTVIQAVLANLTAQGWDHFIPKEATQSNTPFPDYNKASYMAPPPACSLVFPYCTPKQTLINNIWTADGSNGVFHGVYTLFDFQTIAPPSHQTAFDLFVVNLTADQQQAALQNLAASQSAGRYNMTYPIIVNDHRVVDHVWDATTHNLSNGTSFLTFIEGLIGGSISPPPPSYVIPPAESHKQLKVCSDVTFPIGGHPFLPFFNPVTSCTVSNGIPVSTDKTVTVIVSQINNQSSCVTPTATGTPGSLTPLGNDCYAPPGNPVFSFPDCFTLPCRSENYTNIEEEISVYEYHGAPMNFTVDYASDSLEIIVSMIETSSLYGSTPRLFFGDNGNQSSWTTCSYPSCWLALNSTKTFPVDSFLISSGVGFANEFANNMFSCSGQNLPPMAPCTGWTAFGTIVSFNYFSNFEYRTTSGNLTTSFPFWGEEVTNKLVAGFMVAIAYSPPPTPPTTFNDEVNTSPVSIPFGQVDNVTYPSFPQFFNWTAGDTHLLNASLRQTIGGIQYGFWGWNDTTGINASSPAKVVVAPNHQALYLAYYANVSISANVTTLAAPGWVDLKATVPFDVFFSPYFFGVYDLTNNTRVMACGAGTVCDSDSFNLLLGTHAQNDTFIAWLGPSSATPFGSLVNSSTLTVRWTGPVPPPVGVTVETDPIGLQSALIIDGTTYVHNPVTLFWAIGSTHNVTALPTAVNSAFTLYSFSRWSQGGTRSQLYVVSGNATLIAFYVTASCNSSNPFEEALSGCYIPAAADSLGGALGRGPWFGFALLGANVALYNKTQSIWLTVTVLFVAGAAFSLVVPAYIGLIAQVFFYLGAAGIAVKVILRIA